MFDHLVGRWRDLFNASFEVLLYDLTSTYFESDPPQDQNDKRRFGYSRDKRSDCVQVVIALIVTPQGFPLAYDVLAGNTLDKTTLREFLQKIETQYGKAERIWLMDRGIPTEEVLEEMRHSDPPVKCVVGTPRGRLTRLEKQLVEKPWHSARPGVKVKLLAQQGELYVLAESHDRIAKERSMRRRRLKWLWARLKQLSAMTLTREDLLMKLGAAKQTAPSAWRLIKIEVDKQQATFSYRLNRRNCARRAGARGAICCAPICPRAIRPSCGACTSNWWQWKKRLKTSKAIWRSGRSFIKANSASKRTSACRFWPIVCT